MNTTIKIAAIGTLGLFFACADNRTPPPATPGDVAPKNLVARSTPVMPSNEPIHASFAASPRDLVAPPEAPPLTTHRGNVLQIAAGLAPGAHSLVIDATDGAMIYLSGHTQPDEDVLKDIKVLAPDGTVINARAERPALIDGTLPEARPMSAVQLTGHPAGAYTIVTGSIAAKDGLSVFGEQPNASLVMQVQPSVSHMLLGDEASIEVSVQDTDGPVTGASLEGTLVAPDSSPARAMKFVEIGGGNYRAWVSRELGADDATGTYNVTIHAAGTTAAGKAWARDGLTAISYAIPTARIDGVATTRNILDAAGSITGFEADVTLESVSTDRYEVSGTLAASAPDGTERTIGTAQTALVLGAGKHTVTLHFDAGFAKLTGLDGSYVVRNLTLFSQGRATLLHRIGDGMSTAFAPVRLAQLAEPISIPPAVEEMIESGQFKPQ